jgi:hypothetical protein
MLTNSVDAFVNIQKKSKMVNKGAVALKKGRK